MEKYFVKSAGTLLGLTTAFPDIRDMHPCKKVIHMDKTVSMKIYIFYFF